MIENSRLNGKFRLYRRTAGVSLCALCESFVFSVLKKRFLTKGTEKDAENREKERTSMDRLPKKFLERGVKRNIFMLMCSRECYSVSRGSLIAGLLIFLGAFLVGVFATSLVLPLYPLPATDEVTVDPLKLHEIENWRGPFAMVDDIVIVNYVGALSGAKPPWVRFTVTNNGTEQIYFGPPSNRRSSTCTVETAVSKISCEISAEAVNPGGAVLVTAPVPDLNSGVSLYLDVFIGSRSMPDRIKMHGNIP